ncbi:MAG: DinB family protein [Chloroflexota bacterium]|nr:DinB family protein [Chloroflexota bacterium]
MDARELLRSQYAFSQDNLEAAIERCSPELLTKTIEGSLTNPIGATYAHTVITQDLVLVRGLMGQEPVYHTSGIGERVGFELPESPVISQDYTTGLSFELAPLREYAAAVRAAVDCYLESASDEDLLAEVPFGPNPRSKLSVFATLGVWHVASHQGEIAALMGLEGEKGQML